MKTRTIVLFLLLIIALVGVFTLGIYIGVTQFATPAAATVQPTSIAVNDTTGAADDAVLTSVPTAINNTSTSATQVSSKDTIGSQQESTTNSAPTPNTATTSSLSTGSSTSLEEILKSEFGIVLVLLIGVLVLVVLGLVIYFLMIQPRRKRKSLKEAEELLVLGNREALEQSEQKLVQALQAGMQDKDIREARFSLAYTRAKLGKNAEAALVIEDLKGMGNPDRETLYLDLYLQSQLEGYAKIEKLYDEHRDMLINFRDSKYLFSIAFFERGKYFWNLREVEQALKYFDRTRELGVDQVIQLIPDKIEDKYIVFGIMALHAQNFEEAKKNFDDAIENAQANNLSNTGGQIGLILHDWLTRHDVPQIRHDLEMIAKAIKDNDDEGKKLLSTALLWRIILEIVSWRTLPEKQGLPDDNRRAVFDLLAQIKQLDSELNDAHLIEGLLDYLFSHNDLNIKRKAVEKLKRGTDKGINLAEVQNMIEQEDKTTALYKTSETEYLKLVKSYLENKSIPEEHRLELKRYLSKFSPYRPIVDIDIYSDDYTSEPTMEDLQNRSDLISRRVDTLITVKSDTVSADGQQKIRDELQTLREISKELKTKHDALEKSELTLLETTGQFLLPEEEGIGGEPNFLADIPLLPMKPGYDDLDQTNQDHERDFTTGNEEAFINHSRQNAPTVALIENSQFSAYYPEQITIDAWYPLHAYILRESAASQVVADAQEKLGEQRSQYSQTTQTTKLAVAPGAIITVTPYMNGFQFKPRSISVGFYEDWERVDFHLRTKEAPLNKFSLGTITFTLGGIIVADIPISIYVGDTAKENEMISASNKPYDRVFCSYSHEDISIVKRVEIAYTALGLDFLRDGKTLKSGQSWDTELLKLIEQADIFQLFWSSTAANSPYVQREWKHAAKLVDEVQKKSNFIRPVYWGTPMPPPPEKLSHIHFVYQPELKE